MIPLWSLVNVKTKILCKFLAIINNVGIHLCQLSVSCCKKNNKFLGFYSENLCKNWFFFQQTQNHSFCKCILMKKSYQMCHFRFQYYFWRKCNVWNNLWKIRLSRVNIIHHSQLVIAQWIVNLRIPAIRDFASIIHKFCKFCILEIKLTILIL